MPLERILSRSEAFSSRAYGVVAGSVYERSTGFSVTLWRTTIGILEYQKYLKIIAIACWQGSSVQLGLHHGLVNYEVVNTGNEFRKRGYS